MRPGQPAGGRGRDRRDALLSHTAQTAQRRAHCILCPRGEVNVQSGQGPVPALPASDEPSVWTCPRAWAARMGVKDRDGWVRCRSLSAAKQSNTDRRIQSNCSASARILLGLIALAEPDSPVSPSSGGPACRRSSAGRAPARPGSRTALLQNRIERDLLGCSGVSDATKLQDAPMSVKTSTTFSPVLADVSKNRSEFSSA